jgi:hypothetical protein
MMKHQRRDARRETRRDARLFLLYMLLLFLVAVGIGYVGAASAQNAVALDLNLANVMQPSLTWSATPADGASCAASGGWSGAKAPAGSESVAPIRGTSSFVLDCTWPADSQARIDWVNATTNLDGSPYTNPAGVRLVWSNQGNLAAFDCLQPGVLPPGTQTYFAMPTPSTYTVTGLAPGSWIFGAYSVATTGLCSPLSNTATKAITPAVTLTDSVTVSVPSPVGGVTVN